MLTTLKLNPPVASLTPVIETDGRPRTTSGRSSRLKVAGLLSLTLHALVLMALLGLFNRAPRIPESPDREVAVELVLNKANVPGLTPAPQSAPRTEPASPATEQSQADEALPLPPTPPPAPPAEQPQEAPQITLGGNNSDTNTIVTSMGPYVIPASVDSKYHNRNPIYPESAVRLGETGAVILLIHVSAEGLPTSIDIAQSSGYGSLDQSAQDAVSSWHFLPAVKDGQPIPFDMPLRIVFHLD
jgi:periplasmic protein TonB